MKWAIASALWPLIHAALLSKEGSLRLEMRFAAGLKFPLTALTKIHL